MLRFAIMKRFQILLLPIILLAFSCSSGGSDSPDNPEVPDDPQTPVVPENPGQCIDAPIIISLDASPVLGSSGSIRVYDSSDKFVDEINLADLSGVTIREDDGQMIPSAQITNATLFTSTMDAIKSGSRWRIIHYTPLRIKEKALEIKLHNSVLDFDKEYYLT